MFKYITYILQEDIALEQVLNHLNLLLPKEYAFIPG